jgi:hypothetical protein
VSNARARIQTELQEARNELREAQERLEHPDLSVPHQIIAREQVERAQTQVRTLLQTYHAARKG